MAKMQDEMEEAFNSLFGDDMTEEPAGEAQDLSSDHGETFPEGKKKTRRKDPEVRGKKGHVLSVWTSPEASTEWKAYATATGRSVSELAGLAMAEYMKRHKLTDKQKTVYDALKG